MAASDPPSCHPPAAFSLALDASSSGLDQIHGTELEKSPNDLEAQQSKVLRHGTTSNNNTAPRANLPKRDVPELKNLKRARPTACMRCSAYALRCNAHTLTPCARCRWDGAKCTRPESIQSRSISLEDETAPKEVKYQYMGYIFSTTQHEPDQYLDRFIVNSADALKPAPFPAFLKSPCTGMAREDIYYLHKKGAFALPPPEAQRAFLDAYVNYVHPFMPLLDIFSFLAIINASNVQFGQVSLLLYQAVMFAAAAFVDSEFLKNAGYSDRRIAREELFNRTKLLYDFDYETDRTTVVQSLLLMSYWQKEPEEMKDMWHWVGLAISQALVLGLQRDDDCAAISHHQKKLRRRIWWCCIMRDRLISLGMRQTSRIEARQLHSSMLQESDFNFETLPESNTILPSNGVYLRDIRLQQELAALCVAKAELCVHIGDVLSAQYAPAAQDKALGQNTNESAMKLCPKPTLGSWERVFSIDTGLLAWAQRLPPAIQYRPFNSPDTMNGPVLAFHRTFLNMLYETTILALHRCQLLRPVNDPNIPVQMLGFSQLRVRTAAASIAKMVTELNTLGLERYLPTTGVTIILLAMITNLREMRESTQRTHGNAGHCFHRCMHVLQKLRHIYHGADWAAGLIQAALNTTYNQVKPPLEPRQKNPLHYGSTLTTDTKLKPITSEQTELNITTLVEDPGLSTMSPTGDISAGNIDAADIIHVNEEENADDLSWIMAGASLWVDLEEELKWMI